MILCDAQSPHSPALNAAVSRTRGWWQGGKWQDSGVWRAFTQVCVQTDLVAESSLCSRKLQGSVCCLLSGCVCVCVCVSESFVWTWGPEGSCSCCSSVTQWCLTFCDPMDCSTPGFPFLHYLPEFIQTHFKSSSCGHSKSEAGLSYAAIGMK